MIVRTLTPLTVILLLLALAPHVGAVTITVASTQYETRQYEDPVSDDYTWNVVGPDFDGLNLSYVAVALQPDYGAIGVGAFVETFVTYNVTGINGDQHEFILDVWAKKTIVGIPASYMSVTVNGTLAHDTATTTTGILGALEPGFKGFWLGDFQWRPGLSIVYAENATAWVAQDGEGLVWNWTQTPYERAQADGRFYPPSRANIPGGAWYLVSPRHYEDTFQIKNGTETGFFNGVDLVWLGNASAPASIVASTYYSAGTPQVLNIQHRFLTENARLDLKENDDCGFPRLQDFLGLCPSITGVVSAAVQFVPNMIALVIGLVHPDAGNFVRNVGEWAGAFAGIYVYMSILLVASPGKLTVFIVATVSGMSFLIGGLRGDLGTIVAAHKTGFKALGYATFGYFFALWVIARWVLGMFVRVLNMIGNYIPFT